MLRRDELAMRFFFGYWKDRVANKDLRGKNWLRLDGRKFSDE